MNNWLISGQTPLGYMARILPEFGWPPAYYSPLHDGLSANRV